MTEAKPIALFKTGRPRSQKESDNIQTQAKKLREMLPDYHILLVGVLDDTDLKLEVFNGDNISDVEFEELKKICIQE